MQKRLVEIIQIYILFAEYNRAESGVTRAVEISLWYFSPYNGDGVCLTFD